MRIFSEIESMIRPRQCGLEVAQQGVHPGKTGHVRATPPRPNYFRHMNHSSLRDAREAVQPVAEHLGRYAQMTFSPMADISLFERADRIESGELRMALRTQLYRRHKGHFILRSSPGFTPMFTTEVGVIHDHIALQDPSCLAFRHDLHQLVFDLPSGVVIHTDLTGKLQRRGALFTLRQQIDGKEPLFQRQFRAMKDSASRQGGLMVAFMALVYKIP